MSTGAPYPVGKNVGSIQRVPPNLNFPNPTPKIGDFGFAYDNAFPVTVDGILFTTVDNNMWNLFESAPGVYSLWESTVDAYPLQDNGGTWTTTALGGTQYAFNYQGLLVSVGGIMTVIGGAVVAMNGTVTGPSIVSRFLPNQNAIGGFQIGVSPIGTINPFDEWTTVISQYANSPILDQLIENISEYVDQTTNFDDFFDFIWNVDTAQGHGLDIWGRIVGVSRTLELTVGNYFGFEEGSPNSDVFGPGGESPFYSGVPSTNNFTLSDSAYRTLIFAKALANITDGSIKGINQLLINLFQGSPGNAYVTDDGNMQMTYTFTFQLSPVQQAIVFNSGVLPKPVGVAATVVQI